MIDIKSDDTQSDESTELQFQLLSMLTHLSRLQRRMPDKVALHEAVAAVKNLDGKPKRQLQIIAEHLRLKPAKWLKKPDEAKLPMLVYSAESGWNVLAARNARGQWVAYSWNSEQRRLEEVVVEVENYNYFAEISMAPLFRFSESPVFTMTLDALLSRKLLLMEAVAASFLITVIGLFVSFYAMQVFNRVIPSASSQTLMVLTIGVLVGIGFELTTRFLRIRTSAKLIDYIDSQLARQVYLRFLAVRLDQMPKSIGTLASQLKGYEPVRSFLVQLATGFVIDFPFSLSYLVVIFFINPIVSVVPLVFLIASITIGMMFKKRAMEYAKENHQMANFRTGLLVETVEGAETIKSGQGGWRMLRRWLHASDEGREVELNIRHINERSQYLITSLQQTSYVLIMAVGAVQVYTGQMGFGGLLACSILSSRILAPITQIGNLLVQWGNTRASLDSLDAIWKLEDDHFGVEEPLVPDHIEGNLKLQDMQFGFDDRVVIVVPNLTINAGERVGIIGPVGGGKSTLLRLLSGMYRPQQGRVYLDKMDVSHISKPLLAENIGFVAQEGRLFSGTLRENLILGLPDPGDLAIIEAAQKTGLNHAVIEVHQSGLEQPIFEGGVGLSGGQKQLVHLTRTFLRKPQIWLLDEPTASLDRAVERQVVQALQNSIGPQQTMVVVTHKPEILSLVDRVIFINQGRIVLDGPKDQVLAHLQQEAQKNQKPQGRPVPPPAQPQPQGDAEK